MRTRAGPKGGEGRLTNRMNRFVRCRSFNTAVCGRGWDTGLTSLRDDVSKDENLGVRFATMSGIFKFFLKKGTFVHSKKNVFAEKSKKIHFGVENWVWKKESWKNRKCLKMRLLSKFLRDRSQIFTGCLGHCPTTLWQVLTRCFKKRARNSNFNFLESGFFLVFGV